MAKTIAKIIAIIFGVLLILLIVLPIAFRGRIVDMVKREINESVNAHVEFGSFRLSLIRNFPNVSFRVDDVLVVGVDEFEGDTLADIGRLAITFDLMSLFRGDAYEVRSIRLDQPRLLLKVLPGGEANWDIVVMDEPQQEQLPQEESDFKLSLQRVAINNGYLVYHDDLLTTYIYANDLNAVLRGDLTADLTTISTRNATIGSFSLQYETMPILSRVAVQLTAEMDADLNDFIFTFRENRLLLNELPVRFDGMIGMPDDDILMDFTFGAPESEFRHFLSLVPAMYASDFDQLRSSGTLKLAGHVKGTYSDDQIPSFGIELIVNDGMFQYEGMPASVTNVNIDARITNPGGDTDLTVIDVPVFSMNMAGNPFNARLNLRTPESDPQIDAMIRGTIDLGQVNTFYPLEEGMVLAGRIVSDLEARGRLSAVEQGRYQDFHAAGTLQVRDVEFRSNDFAQGIQIPVANFSFTPQNMQMPDFQMRIGDSDLSASGRIDNILGYALDDQLLRGQFDTRSTYFNLNQFMEDTPETETDEPMELSVIRVPENIDFTLRSRFNTVAFSNLELNNVSGTIRIANQEATLENIRMEVLQGTVVLNGAYNTSEALPAVRFGMNITGIDIQQTFHQFNTVQILAPIGEFASGRISANLDLNTLLTDSLMPVLTTLTGSGSLRSNNLQVADVPAMNQLSSQLNVDLFREFSLRDLAMSFSFADGRVDVNPFDIRIGDVVATVSGANFFDQTIDYVMNIGLPRQLFGGQANQVLDNLVGQAARRGLDIQPGQTVNVDVVIGGSFTDPRLSLGLSGMVDGLRDQLREGADQLLRDAEDRLREEAEKARDQVKEAVEGEVDKASQQLQQELEARATRVIEQAQLQADNLRAEGRRAADAIRQEAQQQASRLESEASGPLAKAAAKRAGEALIREANQRATGVETEADRNAENLMSQARQQADRIRAGEE